MSHLGASHSVDRPVGQQSIKNTTTEAVRLIQVGVRMPLEQAVVDSWKKRLGIIGHDMS